jgi:D-alanyl-lipoteichoic acid acyltransferase DltB (MBOAT superfamily)
VNILIVFAVSGLWHGASWTFVVWGILHGFVYLTEKLANKALGIKEESDNVFLNAIRIIKTFIIVSFIWIFFRAESMQKAKEIIKAVVRNKGASFETLHVDYKVWGLLLLFILFDAALFNKRIDTWVDKRPIYIRWGVYAILVFALMAMGGTDNVPFIYFQF